MSRGLSATQRQALALLVASKRPLDVTEELLPELGLSHRFDPALAAAVGATQPQAFEQYAAAKLAAGRSAKSVRNHLVLLGLMFKTARRWRWVGENPLDLVDPPPLGDLETETLARPTWPQSRGRTGNWRRGPRARTPTGTRRLAA